MGTTLASLLCRNAKVTLWARDTAVVDEINQTHRHSRYLGDLALNKKLKATNDLETALTTADAVFVAIPSHNFRAVLESVVPYIAESIPIISMTKVLKQPLKKG